jgi:hypothetical protein
MLLKPHNLQYFRRVRPYPTCYMQFVASQLEQTHLDLQEIQQPVLNRDQVLFAFFIFSHTSHITCGISILHIWFIPWFIHVSSALLTSLLSSH